jgi:hypothetical protein
MSFLMNITKNNVLEDDIIFTYGDDGGDFI